MPETLTVQSQSFLCEAKYIFATKLAVRHFFKRAESIRFRAPPPRPPLCSSPLDLSLGVSR